MLTECKIKCTEVVVTVHQLKLAIIMSLKELRCRILELSTWTSTQLWITAQVGNNVGTLPTRGCQALDTVSAANVLPRCGGRQLYVWGLTSILALRAHLVFSFIATTAQQKGTVQKYYTSYHHRSKIATGMAMELPILYIQDTASQGQGQNSVARLSSQAPNCLSLQYF